MKKKERNKGLIFVGIGIELIGIELSFIYIGRMVDKEMNWPGFGVAFFGIAGLTIWLWHVVRLLRQFDQEEES